MTDVGVIPEDWEVKSIGDICVVKDGTHQTPNYTYFGIPFYSVENISNNDFSNVKYISEEEHIILSSNSKIEKGDVLMTRIGSIGCCKYIDWEVKASFYVSLALLKFQDDECARYFTHYSETNLFKDEIEQNSLQFAVPQKINLGNIPKIRIILPSILKEQQAIADALTKVDNLIMSLSKVIEKKKLIKKGTMQKLLSGEVRLDGFEGEWNFISFKNIYTYASEGGTPDTKNEKYYKSGVIPFVKIEDTISKYIKCASTFITELGLEQSSAWILPAGNLILTNGATIGNVSINLIPITTKQGILGIIVNSDYHTEFLYYLFKNETFQTELQSKMAIGTFATITLNNLNDIQLLIPPTKVEQTAIAKVLTTMDNEIEALEKERDKYKCIKQGMMQQLLTGKIRLICQ